MRAPGADAVYRHLPMKMTDEVRCPWKPEMPSGSRDALGSNDVDERAVLSNHQLLVMVHVVIRLRGDSDLAVDAC